MIIETINSKSFAAACNICGKPVVFRYFKTYQKRNPDDYLHWRRVLVRSWWCCFDADTNEKHQHRKIEEVAA